MSIKKHISNTVVQILLIKMISVFPAYLNWVSQNSPKYHVFVCLYVHFFIKPCFRLSFRKTKQGGNDTMRTPCKDMIRGV